ncbi:LOW QUALITY PROTEIN: X-box-binding protein 1 [Lacerta agilis]|uniref:LOW QUALITY PROTEIN: X-box-binding protein 1 n=1 Tax=Lacerta agilis TaxID=80427 RepID=UPI00141A64B6|nr:LOW QUALITY PROTEIN: X-box-binding protein 1 [Lacerta agilis]
MLAMRKGLFASQSAGARGIREEQPCREEERAAVAAAIMVPLPVPASGPPPPHPRLLLLPAASASSSAAASAATLASPGAALSPPPRKRQRLAHLSPEEKALRRKLKNRVAAQSARDRKKARMGELERQAVELEAENQKLLAENQALRERTHSLARENRELRLRLGLPTLEAAAAPTGAEGGAAPTAVALKVEMLEEEEEGEQPERGSTIGATAGSAESAALRLRVPLQQGQAQQPLASVVMASADPDNSDSSDSESDLLLGILDSLDPDLFLHYGGSAEPACVEKLHQEASGEADSLPASPSSSLGSTTPKLEAINELIRFDHEYTKPFFLEIVAEGEGQANMLVRIEEVVPPSSESVPLEYPISVKEEPVNVLLPELGVSHLLTSDQKPQLTPCLLDASSDSGYEGSPSPFSDLSSPLDAEYGWEEAFANELFPQLISV